ncbi:hypothetical protein D779_1419 [Imhoffiella purpurea]|uniref:Uncharacterized protein n=1 Tax=Imhoffiella purpurea TaxID=1249627 RepID=W9V704_9GAMM|nr:hypothetical protein D779_1419 [Imhoffiella purpurea]
MQPFLEGVGRGRHGWAPQVSRVDPASSLGKGAADEPGMRSRSRGCARLVGGGAGCYTDHGRGR